MKAFGIAFFHLRNSLDFLKRCRREVSIRCISFRREFFLGFFFLACGNAPFLEYVEKLPSDESINATEYSYELLVGQIRKDIENEHPVSAFDHCMQYFRIFEKEDKWGKINYYLDYLLRHYPQHEDFLSRLSHTNSEERSILRGIPLTPRLIYSNQFLHLQLGNRVDYNLEKQAAETLYILRLWDLRANLLEKMKILEFFSKRFPDSPSVMEFLRSDKGAHFISALPLRKKKRALEFQSNIIHNQHGEVTLNWIFLAGDFITMRNKRNYLFSRHLHSFESWEEVEILGYPGESIPSEGWVNVRYGEIAGFMERKYLMIGESFPPKDRHLFREAQTLYLKKRFLEAEQKATKLIGQARHRLLKERAVALLYRIHGNIARRATSIHNPYLRYVLRYPHYFEISDDGLNLKPSLILFRFLRKINKDSSLLSIFEKEMD